MAQQSFAGLAVLVALTFAFLALNACANSQQSALAPEQAGGFTTPEFHDATIGGDALRSRLASDS
jgi:uncharacterized caspase-like protein